jgi:hypothetical protein
MGKENEITHLHLQLNETDGNSGQHRPFWEELSHRMQNRGTDDPWDVIYNEASARLVVLKHQRSFEESTQLFALCSEQGARWLERRKDLGLTLDEVAGASQLSAWDLHFIEIGLPHPDQLSLAISSRLDGVLRLNGQA